MMNSLRLPRVGSALLVCLGLSLTGICLAQDDTAATDLVTDAATEPQLEDTLLQSYGLAAENLSEAVSTLSSDRARSRDALDRALQTLRPLSRDTRSAGLVSALEATFERAATAIQNGSVTDLAVQTAVLEGGLQRLVYESALSAANTGDVETARSRLSRIAQDMDFSEAALADLDAQADAGRLLTSFDAGAAQAIQQSLGTASEQSGADKAASYQGLARAYSAFLPVQDSPRLEPAVNTQFVEAFGYLLEDDSAALEQTLVSLSQSVGNFEGAAAAALEGETPLPPAPSNEDVATPVDPEANALETLLPDTEAAAPEADAATDAAPNAEDASLDSTLAEPTTLSPNTLSRDAPSRDDIVQSFGPYRLSDADVERLSAIYAQRGLSGPDDALDSLYATSARALIAVETGNQVAAKEHIEDYRTTYEELLGPIVAAQDASVDTATERLALKLGNAPGLRLQDTAVLVGHVEAVAQALNGAGTSAAHRTQLGTTVAWAGWPRLIVTLLLGLLAFVPLRFLNMAFGGANRNWQLIGAALFLLLLPIIYEGLSSLGALLASASNVGALDGLATFSIFQNTLAQVIWVVLTALAIALASAGLYGICVQFGLMGRDKANDMLVTQETRANDGLSDWDEEF